MPVPPPCPICGAAMHRRKRTSGWHLHRSGYAWYCPVAKAEETKDADGRRGMVPGAVHECLLLYPEELFVSPPADSDAPTPDTGNFPF